MPINHDDGNLSAFFAGFSHDVLNVKQKKK